MKHCCVDMEISVVKEEYALMEYEEETRRYFFRLYNNPDGDIRGMAYCPWCGSKLPRGLDKEWCAEIKKKFGYDSVYAEEWAKLPEKYKTEQWWREKGL